MIVPARNEAATIGILLASLRRTSYPNAEFIIVNDRSTDGTAAAIAAAAGDDPRVRVIEGADPPPGWYGKPWACYQGYRAARGDLLAFTDADTRHEPGLLLRATGAMRRAGADLLSVIPRQVCLTFWERVIMPQVGLMLALRFSPGSVNRARRSRDVIANGQFILVGREQYEKIGTHERVRDRVAEDLALAQAFHRDGAIIHLAHAEELIETRMYDSLPALVEGWSKNLYLGSRASFPDNPWIGRFAPVGLVLGLWFWLAPPLWLLAGAVAGFETGVAAAALATVLSATFWVLACIGTNIPPAYGLLYPLGAAMAMYIVVRSLVRGSRAVEWRGRVYSGIEGAADR